MEVHTSLYCNPFYMSTFEFLSAQGVFFVVASLNVLNHKAMSYKFFEFPTTLPFCLACILHCQMSTNSPKSWCFKTMTTSVAHCSYKKIFYRHFLLNDTSKTPITTTATKVLGPIFMIVVSKIPSCFAKESEIPQSMLRFQELRWLVTYFTCRDRSECWPLYRFLFCVAIMGLLHRAFWRVFRICVAL